MHGRSLGYPYPLFASADSEDDSSEDTDAEVDNDKDWTHSLHFTYTSYSLKTGSLASLSTCHRIYDEGTDVLYGETEFEIQQDESRRTFTTKAVTDVLENLLLDRPEASRRKINVLKPPMEGHMAEPRMLQFVKGHLSLRHLVIALEQPVTPLPIAANGALNTLWQYFLPRIFDLSSLEIDGYWDWSRWSLRPEHSRFSNNILMDASAALVAAVLKRTVGIEAQSDVVTSRVDIIHCNFQIRFACFHPKEPAECEWIGQLVPVRREQLDAEQEQILNEEVSATAGLGGKRSVWVIEEVAKKVGICHASVEMDERLRRNREFREWLWQ